MWRRIVALVAVVVVLSLVPLQCVSAISLRANETFWHHSPHDSLKHVTRGTVADDAAIIPLGAQQQSYGASNIQNAYSYVFKNLHSQSSDFILYPYPFDINGIAAVNYTKSSSTIGTSFPQGAVLAFDSANDGLPDKNDPRAAFFEYIRLLTSIDIDAAKAIYDTNIAMLNVVNGVNLVTYEVPTLCTALHLYLNKYDDCLTYQAFESTATAGENYLVSVTPDDIGAGALISATGALNFGILILPDFDGSEYSTVIDQLTTAGALQSIIDFTAAGGNIITSGKGAVLLESLNLISAGFFDRNTIIQSSDNSLIPSGCDSSDFDVKTLCFSLLPNANNQYPGGILGPYKVVGTDPSLDLLLSIDPSVNPNVYQTSLSTGLSSHLSAVHPYLLRKNLPKSKIIINLGASTLNAAYYPWLFNALFLINSKPIFFDWTANPSVVPAFESVATSFSLTATNLFSSPLTGFNIRVWKQIGTNFFSYPSNCQLEAPPTVTPPSISNIDTTENLLCSSDSVDLAAFATASFDIKAKITDPSITQSKYNVWILYPTISYTFGTADQYLEPGYVTVNALSAATVYADYNPDPSSVYPLPGSGAYTDNVLAVQNKAETQATEVVHYAIVPLVSPFFDMSDQTALATLVRFDYHYYEWSTNLVDNYTYPFENAQVDTDYLDYQIIGSRDAILAADWDTPVKIYKIARTNPPFPTVAGGSSIDVSTIGNVNYQTNIDSNGLVTKQVYFSGSDQFFEHAAQRLMVYVDTSKPGGANAYFGSDPITYPTGSGTEKKRVVFVRQDVYFYTNPVSGAFQYPQPNGLPDRNSVITVDQYISSCSGKINVLGCYTGSNEASCPNGIVENQYNNALLCDPTRTRVDYKTIQNITNGQVEQIHYLVPIPSGSGITSANDVAMFSLDVSGDFVYDSYLDVKFIFAHNAKFTLDPLTTPYGGYIKITLPTGTSFLQDALAGHFIQYSADQIAILYHKVDSVNGQQVITTYFKRGNNPDQTNGKPNQLEVNLEMLSPALAFNASVEIYSLTYDLNSPATNFETYSIISSTNLTFSYIPLLSLPAVKLALSVERPQNGVTASYLFPYENFEPYARYGIYAQELSQHSTVYASPEIHPVNDPGFVVANGGGSYVTHVGISSIPFREYLSVGAAQLIPAAPETGRVEFKDIWGRSWAQPVRSIFVDIPPIPPPLRNFMMTTTFEVLDATTGEYINTWNSREEVDVRVQVKLLNNYPKYFEITACADNNIMQLAEYGVTRRVFTPVSNPLPVSSYTDKQVFVSLGFNASYGACFQQSTTVLSGYELQPADFNAITNAQLCSQSGFNSAGEACQHLPNPSITISKRPDGLPENSTWNYSPRVNNFYPEYYIQPNMWDLTHYDYDDTPFDKAYKYHMDNNLPNIDKGLQKPQNIITVPLLKGVGYQMTYSNTYQTYKYQNKYPSGWWSDNLQNRDDTVLVAQATSQNVSVGNPDLTDGQWIFISDLHDAGSSSTNALKNIYTCLFNRWRVEYDPQSNMNSYPDNVYINNIIPIAADLDSDSPDYYGYACGNEFYTPNNISTFTRNYVSTQSARDWLYFGANLRGGAKETVNVVYQLKPLEQNGEQVQYEDLQTDVADGGQFVYWNPANGPNSFLIVRNPVNLIQSIRNDITVEGGGFPVTTTTTNSIVYLLTHVLDEPEIGRQYDLSTYTNSKGFGDSSITTTVGGFNGSTSIVTPGSTTTVQIAFYNNAGFDWNLKFVGLIPPIDFVGLGSYSLSANDLLYNIKHTVQLPIAYNFLSFSCVDDPSIMPYLTITPSASSVGKAPLFFDFENINVATIRDGFNGLYYVDVSVAASFPPEKTGRLYNIQVTLNESFFDRLPSYNDPTPPGYHTYRLSIPDIVIGIPYASSAPSDLAGKVFYTSGYSTAVQVQHNLANEYTVVGAKLISLVNGSQIDAGTISDVEGVYQSSSTNVPFSVSSSYVTYNLSDVAPKFPIPQPPTDGYLTPDQAELYILTKLEAASLTYGSHIVSNSLTVSFKDWSSILRTYSPTFSYTVFATGPFISGSFIATIIDAEGNPLEDQVLAPGAEQYINLQITVVNTGSAYAYNVEFVVVFGPGVTPILDNLPPSITSYNTTTDPVTGQIVLTLKTSQVLVPGTPLVIPFNIIVTPTTIGTFEIVSSVYVVYTQLEDPASPQLIQLIGSSFSVQVQAITIVLPTVALAGKPEVLGVKNIVATLTANASIAQPGFVFVWQRIAPGVLTTLAITNGTLSTSLIGTLTTPINCGTQYQFNVYVAELNDPATVVALSNTIDISSPCPPSSSGGSTRVSSISTTSGTSSTTGRKPTPTPTRKCVASRIVVKGNKIRGASNKKETFVIDEDGGTDSTIDNFSAVGSCKDRIDLRRFSNYHRFSDLDIEENSKGVTIKLPRGQKLFIPGVTKAQLRELIEFLEGGNGSSVSFVSTFIALIISLILLAVM